MGKDKTIIGVIGGMGPLATVDFYRRMIENTSGDNDQDHLHVIIDSNTRIPDRSAAIESGNLEPLLRALEESANRLVAAGAQLIAIPCVTAHVVYDELQQRCPVEILHIVKEVELAFARTSYARPLLLASRGTVASRLFERFFNGVELFVPNSDTSACGGAERLRSAIADIKACRIQAARSVLLDLVERHGEHTDSVLVGCTDISAALNGRLRDERVFDASGILASAVCERFNA